MNTYDTLKVIVTQRMDKNEEQFSWEANYKNDLGLDSLEMVILVCHIEETFGIDVPDEEMNEIMTVASTVELIEKHLAETE